MEVSQPYEKQVRVESPGEIAHGIAQKFADIIAAEQERMKMLETEMLEKQEKWNKLFGRFEVSQLSEPVVLNVGGVRFATSMDTLNSMPDTYLSTLLSGRWDLKCSDDGSLFIDRNPLMFGYLLEFLRDPTYFHKIHDLLTAQELNQLEEDCQFFLMQSLDQLRHHSTNKVLKTKLPNCILFPRIYKLLKKIHLRVEISKIAMLFVQLSIEFLSSQVSQRAAFFAKTKNSQVISTLHVQSALREVFVGEVARNAIREGRKAVAKLVAAVDSTPAAAKSRTTKSGLLLPVGVFSHFLRDGNNLRVHSNASVTLAAAVEYVVSETLELGGYRGSEITSELILRSWYYDPELNPMLIREVTTSHEAGEMLVIEEDLDRPRAFTFAFEVPLRSVISAALDSLEEDGEEVYQPPRIEEDEKDSNEDVLEGDEQEAEDL